VMILPVDSVSGLGVVAAMVIVLGSAVCGGCGGYCVVVVVVVAVVVVVWSLWLWLWSWYCRLTVVVVLVVLELVVVVVVPEASAASDTCTIRPGSLESRDLLCTSHRQRSAGHEAIH